MNTNTGSMPCGRFGCGRDVLPPETMCYQHRITNGSLSTPNGAVLPYVMGLRNVRARVRMIADTSDSPLGIPESPSMTKGDIDGLIKFQESGKISRENALDAVYRFPICSDTGKGSERDDSTLGVFKPNQHGDISPFTFDRDQGGDVVTVASADNYSVISGTQDGERGEMMLFDDESYEFVEVDFESIASHLETVPEMHDHASILKDTA